MKSENKKRHNCLRINKIVCNKDEKGKKPFIKKEELKKDNLLKTKKKLFSKNSAPSTLQVNNLEIRYPNQSKIIKSIKL